MRSFIISITILIIASLPTFSNAQSPSANLAPISSQNVEQLTELAHLEQGSLGSQIWFPDGDRLAVSGSLGLWIFDITHPDNPPRLLDSFFAPFSLSSDGITAAARDERGDIVLWDQRTGEKIKTFYHTLPNIPITALQFSPDGSQLAMGYWSLGPGVMIWDVEAEEQIIRLGDDDNPGTLIAAAALEYSRDGSLLAVGTLSGVFVYDTATWERLTTPYASGASAIAFNQDGTLLAQNNYRYGTVRVMNLVSQTSLAIPNSRDYLSVSGAVDFSPENPIILATTGYKAVQLWDAATGALLNTFERGYGVAFSPTGNHLGVVTGSELIIYDIDTATEAYRFEGFNNHIGAVLFSDDGQTLAYERADGTIQLWDTETREEIVLLSVETDWQTVGVDFPIEARPDTFMEFETYDPTPRFLRFVVPVVVQAYTVTQNNDFSLNLVDLATNTVLHTLVGHDYPLGSFRISSDGHWLVTADQLDLGQGWADVPEPKRSVRVWNIETGEQATILLESRNHLSIEDIVFSPNGRYVAMKTLKPPDSIIEIWDTYTWQKLGTFLPSPGDFYTGRYVQVIFNATGDLLVAINSEGSIEMLDVMTGTKLTDLADTRPARVLFSPDGTLLIVVGADNTMRIFGVPQ